MSHRRAPHQAWAARGSWRWLGVASFAFAVCAPQSIQASKRDAMALGTDAQPAGERGGVPKPGSLSPIAPGAPLDSDTGADSEAGGSGITFGRTLDLQGSPIRLGHLSGHNARSRFGSVRSDEPSSLPSGMPVRSRFISSGFGTRWHPIYGGYRLHAGIDIVAPLGSPVFATSAGTVIVAGQCGGYGLCVAIDHGGGVVSIYGHLSRIEVRSGSPISRRQEIGQVGSTGTSTGPHLHYEVRVGDRPVNPVRYLAK